MLSPVRTYLDDIEGALSIIRSELYFRDRAAGTTDSVRDRSRPWLESLDNNVYIALREMPL